MASHGSSVVQRELTSISLAPISASNRHPSLLRDDPYVRKGSRNLLPHKLLCCEIGDLQTGDGKCILLKVCLWPNFYVWSKSVLYWPGYLGIFVARRLPCLKSRFRQQSYASPSRWCEAGVHIRRAPQSHREVKEENNRNWCLNYRKGWRNLRTRSIKIRQEG